MERSPMLMDWQCQYCENVYITKSNLHVQYNPHQTPMIFTPEITGHNTQLHTLFQSHSNKNCLGWQKNGHEDQ
jgi:hypothetical protein